MKKLNHLNYFVFLFSCIILSSCTNIDFVKRKYMSGYYVDINKYDKISNREIKGDLSDKEFAKAEVKWQTNNISSINNENINDALIINKKRNAILFSNDTINKCDEMILKNGDIIYSKVTDIGLTEIKYKKCNNLEGPSISVLKSDVFMIKYANGTKEVFNAAVTNKPNPQYDPPSGHVNPNSYYEKNKPLTQHKTTSGLAIASMIFGLLGLILGLLVSGIVGVVLGMMAILFGGEALAKINHHPDKFEGKGLAITGLITGILITILFALMLLLIIVLI